MPLVGEERLFLHDLFECAGGENWRRKDGWGQEGVDPASWFGVSVEDDRLVALALPANGLTGFIPETISNCSALVQLDLSFNMIGGALPAAIGDLIVLEELFLHGNRFGGEIPETLCDCTEMRLLWLWGNNLEGRLHEGLLLPNLTHLWAFNNNFAEIPVMYQRQKQLQECIIQQSDTRQWPLLPSARPLPAEEIAFLRELYARCSGSRWKKRFNWDDVNADPSQWHGILIEKDHIAEISLVGNFLKGQIPASIAVCRQLRILNVSRNLLSGPLPNTLSSTQMEELNASQNRITHLPCTIGECTGLVRLDMKCNKLFGPIPASLGNLSNLQELVLSFNLLTGDIPADLGRCARLARLYLSQNTLSGLLPPELGGLHKLEELRAYENELTGKIPPELGRLHRLRELQLQSNKFFGELPHALGNCAALQVLDLGDNKLRGDVPDAIGLCTNLKTLILSDNLFTGSLPATFEKLKLLEQLQIQKTRMADVEFAEQNLRSQLNCANVSVFSDKR